MKEKYKKKVTKVCPKGVILKPMPAPYSELYYVCRECYCQRGSA